MANSPRTSAQSSSLINSELLSELRAAHRIIRNALTAMGTAQKFTWAGMNARGGVDGEGATRANEREAVIARAIDATTAMPNPNTSEDYRGAFDAGRKRAGCWFAQHGHTLAVFRDLKRAEYVQGLLQASSDSAATLTGFDAGFSAGLADLIAGVRHD